MSPAVVGLEGVLAPDRIRRLPARRGIFLIRAAKALAHLDGRGYVTPDDIKNLVLDVLRHRLILTYRADAEGIGPDAILGRVLDSVRVP